MGNDDKMTTDEKLIVLFAILFICFIMFMFVRGLYYTTAEVGLDDYCYEMYGNNSKYNWHNDFGYSCTIPIKENRTFEYNYFETEAFDKWVSGCKTPKFWNLLDWEKGDCRK